jgi:hypothetical protein
VRLALEQGLELSDVSAVSFSLTDDLTNSELPQGVIDAARSLELYQVSPILQTADMYYIIRIEARQVADTLTASAMEEYTKQMRDAIFNQTYQTWRDGEPEIVINHDVFDGISINDLLNIL